MDNAILVSEQGWKEADQILIEHIIKNQELFLQEFLVVNDLPFSEHDYYSQGEKLSFLP